MYFECIKNFSMRIKMMQSRAKLQIHLYQNCGNDVLQRLNVCIEQIKMHLIENKAMQKKYPSVIKQLMKVEDCHKRQVIKDLMSFYKLTHTIQIQRYLLKSRGHFNSQLYTSLTNLIRDRMEQE